MISTNESGNIIHYKLTKQMFNKCASFSTGIGASASNSVYWLLVFVFNLVIPYMLGPPINLYGFLYLMAGTNLLACFFVALAIPETKVTLLIVVMNMLVLYSACSIHSLQQIKNVAFHESNIYIYIYIYISETLIR